MSWKKQIATREEWLKRLPRKDKKLYAMYSSVTDCIVTDQSLMHVPVDDHMVHRGDGVFESFKCVNGSLYNLEEHLIRLERSCSALSIAPPFSPEGFLEVTVQTVRAGKRPNALVRLLVSRGQGTMGINPYACLGSECYIVVYQLEHTDTERLSEGVRVGVSKIPVKSGIFAQIKTCNYLPNVLMKKEAVDTGVDFTIALDEKRNLAEGATENIGIVSPEKGLFIPPPDRVLLGTTAKRAFAFAQQLKMKGLLTAAEFRPVSLEEARLAAEIHIYGTSSNITPVTQFDGQPVGEGRPGYIAQQLFEMINREMIPENNRLTKVF